MVQSSHVTFTGIKVGKINPILYILSTKNLKVRKKAG